MGLGTRILIFIVICKLLILSSNVSAQNLIPNPGFEEMINCPPASSHDYRKSLYYVVDWQNANMGSCDYLHTCLDESNYTTGSLGFLESRPEPRSGEACLGFVVYSPDIFYNTSNYREIPMIKLSEPLQLGEIYEIEINLKLADVSNFFISNFNLYFAKDERELYRETRANDVILQSRFDEERQITHDHYISEKESWKSIYFTYQSKGGEQYLLLGNFRPNGTTNNMNSGNQPKDGRYKSFCYYLIDDVWMSKKGQVLIQQNFKESFRWNIRNLEFETGKADMDPSRNADLERLVGLLKENPGLGLNIIGHTDKEGDKTFNLGLSFDRAKNVRKYLMDGGIQKERLKISGMGSIYPIASNKTEAGKQRNRRVEVEVISIP